MAAFTETALRLLRLYGPLALALFTFLETSMLFPFLPSEVIVPAAAALIVTDPASFLLFVAAATVGGTAGSFLPFYLFRDSRIGGNDWIRERIHVSEERLQQGREWFDRWGRSSVLWGRFLPAFRSVVSIPAGLTKMGATRFGAYTATGSVGFYAAAGGVVYYGRQQSLYEVAYTVATDHLVLTGVGLLATVGVGLLVWRWSRP